MSERGIVAIIPARGGSKRVPGKNFRFLGGKPLIGWTIQSALEVGAFEQVIVSTDDEEIAEFARSSGAVVPWLRSPELATDVAGVVDVIIEVLDRMAADGVPAPEGIALLQPTSPFRSCDTVRSALDAFAVGGGESVIGVSRARSHPWWCKVVGDDGVLSSFVDNIDTAPRSQDLPPVFVVNGAIYVASVETVRGRRSLYSERSRGLLMTNEAECVDIDTEFDWMVAEAVAAANFCRHK